MIERRHTPYLRLKAYLIEKGIPQKDFAPKIGLSASTFNQKLNGTGGSDFSMDEVRKICRLTRMSADNLFFYQEVSKTKQEEVS